MARCRSCCVRLLRMKQLQTSCGRFLWAKFYPHSPVQEAGQARRNGRDLFQASCSDLPSAVTFSSFRRWSACRRKRSSARSASRSSAMSQETSSGTPCSKATSSAERRGPEAPCSAIFWRQRKRRQSELLLWTQVHGAWAKEWRLPARDTMSERDFNTAYLNAAIAAGKGGTGIFGLRLMRENLDELSAILDQIFPKLPSDSARLENAFGRILYIHLSREDKLAQAIS